MAQSAKLHFPIHFCPFAPNSIPKPLPPLSLTVDGRQYNLCRRGRAVRVLIGQYLTALVSLAHLVLVLLQSKISGRRLCKNIFNSYLASVLVSQPDQNEPPTASVSADDSGGCATLRRKRRSRRSCQQHRPGTENGAAGISFRQSGGRRSISRRRRRSGLFAGGQHADADDDLPACRVLQSSPWQWQR